MVTNQELSKSLGTRRVTQTFMQMATHLHVEVGTEVGTEVVALRKAPDKSGGP
jgi:hypothetical protein